MARSRVPCRPERAAEALSARGVDREQAASVIELQFAGRAGDRLGGVVDEGGEVFQLRGGGAVGEPHIGSARVVQEGIEALAGTERGAAGHISQAQFIERGPVGFPAGVLPDRGAVPVQPESFQFGEDAVAGTRDLTPGVDVLDPDQPLAARGAG